MDFGDGWESDEAIVGGGGDETGSNSATTITLTTSVPLSKKRYKKLGIAKFVLDCLI